MKQQSNEVQRTNGEWTYKEERGREYRICDEYGFWIAHVFSKNQSEEQDQSKANAEFICKAVNNHDKLVAMLEKVWSDAANIPEMKKIVNKIDGLLNNLR